MDEEARNKIFLQAAGCMENLVGGSGHLASYTLDEASFVITSVRDLGGGLTEYGFSALATLETEFSSYVEEIPPEDPQPEGPQPDDPLMLPVELLAPTEGGQPEGVSATLVLDATFGLALNDQGNLRLGGYTCLPPNLWHPDHRPG